MKKIAIVHSGIQHSNFLAEELFRAGLLETYITPFLATESMVWLARLFPQSKLAKVVSLRRCSVPSRYCQTRNFWFMWHLLTSKDSHTIERKFLARNFNISKNALIYTWPTQMSLISSRFSNRFVLEFPIAHFEYLDTVKSKINYKVEFPNTFNFSYTKEQQLMITDEVDRAYKVLYPSEFVRKSLLHAHNEIEAKLLRITYASTLREHRSQSLEDSEKLMVLFVGQLSERKGLSILNSIVKEFEDVKNIQFTFIGQKVAEDKYYSSLNWINFKYIQAVSREELQVLMSNHQLFIMPSLFEGSALVLHEAFACGMCILATENCGADFIDNCKNGFILNNAPTDFIEKIYSLLQNRAWLSEIRHRVVSSQKPQWSDNINLFKSILEGSRDNPEEKIAKA